MFEKYEAILKTIRAGFHNAPILVIGDLILDCYLHGEVNRISPEGPVPVVHLIKEEWRCGGAANVAMNLSNLGLTVQLAGLLGADEERDKILDLLCGNNINTSGVVVAEEWRTISKTRVISNNQLMLRLDKEEPVRCSSEESKRLFEVIEHNIDTFPPSAIILSDYAKGVLSEALCQKIISLAKSRNIPVLVDPKGNDYSKYAGATLLSPNRSEMADVTHRPAADLDELIAAGQELHRRLELTHLVITLSDKGLVHITENGSSLYPATAKEVYDVSGAGDTVIAIMAAGIAGGLELSDTLHMSNIAAGVVVAKVGVYPINSRELLQAVIFAQGKEQSEKITEFEDLVAKVQQWRKEGARIVFTNGCFDLLHAGHVTYLEQASRCGDRLIVGLNTDRSVKLIKGTERPVISEQDRARVLAALSVVDAVILFDEPTPIRLIQALSPDVLAKGSDYTEDQVVGGNYVKQHGGRVALIPLVEGKSSSAIIKNLSNNQTN